MMKQQPQQEKWEAVGGSNELSNGRQGWPIRTSSLSTPPRPSETLGSIIHVCLRGAGGCGVKLHLMFRKITPKACTSLHVALITQLDQTSVTIPGSPAGTLDSCCLAG